MHTDRPEFHRITLPNVQAKMWSELLKELGFTVICDNIWDAGAISNAQVLTKGSKKIWIVLGNCFWNNSTTWSGVIVVRENSPQKIKKLIGTKSFLIISQKKLLDKKNNTIQVNSFNET